MKTQIYNLRSGKKNQILNPEINYSNEPKSTSHIGHAGSNQQIVDDAWRKVVAENPEQLNATVKGVEVIFKANWSSTGKSVSYWATIDKDVLESIFGITKSKKNSAYIAIHDATTIEVGNGKSSFKYVCPSLIQINK